MKKPAFLYAILVAAIFAGCRTGGNTVTLEKLLDEMVSVEESARFPEFRYTCNQESSYDRRSVSPDAPGWFANADGFGIVRVDTVGDRIEKVLFDRQGPGVITRIWITTLDKRGMFRFYFDGREEPGLIIPGYDLMLLDIPSLGRGLLQPHTSYSPQGKGGNTLFLPVPYARGCKITFEDEKGVDPTPKYYHINYRKYADGVKVETFSKDVVARAAGRIALTDSLLLNPPFGNDYNFSTGNKSLRAGDSLELSMPAGNNAVYEINFNVGLSDPALYGQTMREIVFVAGFDGAETVWVPLGDFSGGGMGAPEVKSWYLHSDGRGNVKSRWVMPYRENASLMLKNLSQTEVDVSMEVSVKPFRWDGRTLYFHSSWRQERGIPIHKYDDEENSADWNFAAIEGRGVYKGDLLSLFNHAPAWYGEGDEKIWVDDDTFPSHFGTGTEDYYNSSWAPVVPFHTPFGGAPRADMESSHGYNAFFRTRNLDGIPFDSRFRFDIEMIGWDPGTADYAVTTYWYGDLSSVASGTSGLQEAKHPLMAKPYDPRDYRIPNGIEFEDMEVTYRSPSIKTEKQGMSGFSDGRWSRAAHLLCTGGQPGDYIELKAGGFEKGRKYRLVLHATSAKDYGITKCTVTGSGSFVHTDGYSPKVTNVKPAELGVYIPEDDHIVLKIQIIGTNDKTTGQRYMFGMDCLEAIPL